MTLNGTISVEDTYEGDINNSLTVEFDNDKLQRLFH